MSFLRVMSVGMVCLLLLSCTYTPKNRDAISMRLSWFSYIKGEDIRQSCRAQTADKYRFIYNGIYQEQTRSYDVYGLSKLMTITIRGEKASNDTSLKSLVGSFNSTESKVNLSDKTLGYIKRSITEGGVLNPREKDLRLSSDEFYWIVNACLDGQFYMNAYKWPHTDLTKLKFAEVLVVLDDTGVAFNPARNLSLMDKRELEQTFDPFKFKVDASGSK